MSENKGASFIRRKRKESKFTQLSNEMLRNENLSWKARGLLAYMLSMPDDWVFYSSELVKHSKKDGETSLRTAMKELKEAGYVQKEAIKDDKGKIIKWVTYVEEEPIFKNQNDENHNVAVQNVDFPHVGNHELLIPIFNNTDNTNNIKDMVDSKESTEHSNLDIQFDEWWNIYGKKKQKPKAFTAFKKVVKKYGYDELKANTEFFVKNHVKDKQYQPYPSTFLNNYHPDDEDFKNIGNQPNKNNYNNYNTSQPQQTVQYNEPDTDTLYSGGDWE